MSGEDESPESSEWQWAHRMFQRHGIRFEEWVEMSRDIQLAYIASELLEGTTPIDTTNRIATALFKKKK